MTVATAIAGARHANFDPRLNPLGAPGLAKLLQLGFSKFAVVGAAMLDPVDDVGPTNAIAL